MADFIRNALGSFQSKLLWTVFIATALIFTTRLLRMHRRKPNATIDEWAATLYEKVQKHHETISSYEYLPLSAPTSIRVLGIWGAQNKNAPIMCRIEEQLLGHLPDYTALSYTWGSQPLDKEIFVTHHGLGRLCKFMITQSCEDAIRAMRPNTAASHLRLWVDAVCINQQDGSERNQQVSIMDKIFAQALQVNIWIGPSTSNAVEFFERLQALTIEWNRRKTNEQHFMYEDPVMDSLIDQAGIVRYAIDIFTRDYWTRTWTLQEVVLGRRHMLYCGEHHYAFPAVFLHLGKRATFGYFARHILFFHTFLEHYSKSNGWGEGGTALTSPLVLGMILQSTDPTDKVFGLRSIFPDILGPIPVDYTTSVANLYREAAERTMISEGMLASLALVTPSRSNQELHLPSWVPDMSRPLPHYHLKNAFRYKLASSRQENKDLNQTSGPLDIQAMGHSHNQDASESSTCPNFTFTNRGKILVIKGRRIGTLMGCSDAFPEALVNRCTSIRSIEDLHHLFYSRQMLDAVKLLRQEAPKLGPGSSESKTILELLIAWEMENPIDGAQLKLEEKIPWKILLAGLRDWALAPRDMGFQTREEMRDKKDGTYWWQHASRWEAMGMRAPAPEDVLQPDSLEAQIIIWLAERDRDFLILLIVQFMPIFGRKRVFVTDQGQYGYADKSVRENDQVCLVDGLDVPLIIRNEEDNTRKTMGWAFIEGAMMGEVELGDERMLEMMCLS